MIHITRRLSLVFKHEQRLIWQNIKNALQKENVGFGKFPDLEELTAQGNVILSGHVAFYTDESVREIASKTIENFEGFLGKAKIDEKAFLA